MWVFENQGHLGGVAVVRITVAVYWGPAFLEARTGFGGFWGLSFGLVGAGSGPLCWARFFLGQVFNR